MSIVNIASYITTGQRGILHAGTKYELRYEEGTIEVTIGRETRRLGAKRYDGSPTIYVQGVVGRYQTGSKAWPASVIAYLDGRESIHFGRDERQRRCRKTTIHFAKEA